ncbi:hypothetical protein EB118_07075 [bacterium]|nr:hypothetical protein [bacterium]NDD82924.1 hypothetical protein [bacterium]NDG29843.1 hypothetical protein [bacterium]
MQIYNAMQLKAGAKVEYNKMGTLNQPIQFIPRKEKDNDWTAWNLDWLEWKGLQHIRRNARRLMKNYKLAKGIIDKGDYIVEEDNEYADLIETLTKEDASALELKFYPIIPNVINTLVSEFAKRTSSVSYRAVDEFSYNEFLELKKEQLQQSLVQDAERKLMQRLVEDGMDPQSEEFQQAMSPENVKSLPEIQGFFDKKYRSIPEQWASHQHNVDQERFGMEELEERAFRDMLITDREFWHFRMLEDDYDVELWNPVLTFYHKSPDARYISQGQWVGKFDMMTVADVIDRYGWLMTEEQMETLEQIYPVRSAGYPIQGYQNDGSYYDGTKSHDWNTNMPSLAYRQYTSMWDNTLRGGDIVNWILSDSEDWFDMGMTNLLRVTTAYWKSQRKVGHLTKIDDMGQVTSEIVDESYVVTDKPIYNLDLFKNKSRQNLLFGEHIDWIYINEVWGGVKIGPNHPTYWGTNNPGGINPIYLGINQNNMGPLKFQFKGDDSLYGCKLPVEGSVFSDRNTRSTSLVDLMKPFQIGYNIVNNQIADILVDELGTVILLDQNALPRHSLGEDWGKNNLAKAYVAMKNFQMLPLDTSITNTENALAFQHYQKLDLEQTNRLMSRINLANYFKSQAFEVIGLTPQRLGQQISQQTATGIEQSINASYAQTEVYFIQHCDYLMPRVHQMRTDLAQYYQSTKPSVRLQYITNTEQRKNFEINGTKLLLRDLNIFCTTKANHRAVVEQLKQLAINNNTTGASIYDLGQLMIADNLPDVNEVLRNAERKQNEIRQQEAQQEQAMQQEALAAKAEEERLKREFEADQNDKNRANRIQEAQIKAAGFGSTVDINENQQSDYMDALKEINRTNAQLDNINLQREKEINRQAEVSQNVNIKQQELNTKREIAQTQLQIARENKNKFDKKSTENKKKK